LSTLSRSAPLRSAIAAVPRVATAPRRTFASEAKAASGGSSSTYLIAAAAVAAGGAYYFYTQQEESAVVEGKQLFNPIFYTEVYSAIASLLDANDYDDGSYGPVLVRLAWHAAGTYDIETKTGGSNGATMRFAPEAAHGGNAGLAVARDLLAPLKEKFPEISYADLWSLAGVVAIQEMGGPTIKWRPGRTDATIEKCTPDGRLPDASQTQDHLRKIFYRQGFNDQEIVALSGAHALGRCHTDRSGFEGPWTFAPTTFSNDYFKKLLEEKWVDRKWSGPKQVMERA
ncbi:heme peroxidase, partial [Blyttiomyces helicus]